MYYRKYFEGDAETEGALSETKSHQFNPSQAKKTIYVNQSRIIGRAVAEVLCDAGMDACYNEEQFVLYPNREEQFGIGLYKTALATTSVCVFDNETSNIREVTTSSGTSYQPFDTAGKTYKFYVTIIGEPKGLLWVYIGSYSSPGSMSWGFVIGYGKDRRDDRKIAYADIGAVSASTVNFYVRHADDNSLVDNMSYQSQAAFSVPKVNGETNKLVLIDAFATSGYFTLDNCFLGCSALSAGSSAFYLINGTQYYYPNSTILLKCPSVLDT